MFDINYKESWKKLNALRNKLPHAILFYGNNREKISFVKYFAQSLLCNNFFLKNSLCEKENFCNSCIFFIKKKHPDYYIIKSDIFKKKNINNESILKKFLSHEIKLEQVKPLIRFINLSTHFSKIKVILLYTVESLNIFAANFLLKILEEPPKNVVFLLITNNLYKVLPTIFSRCYKFILPKINSTNVNHYFFLKKFLNKENKIFFEKIIFFLLNPKKYNIIFLSKFLENFNIKDFFFILQCWVYDLFFIKVSNNIKFFYFYKNELLLLSNNTTIDIIDTVLKKINGKFLIYKSFLIPRLFIEDILIDYQSIFIS